MRCPVCGQRLAEGAARCPACETIIADWMAMHPDVRLEPETPVHMEAEAAPEPEAAPVREDAPVKPDKPMKWYWFLVHISLVFSSFMDFWGGYQIFTGTTYGGREAADKIYELYADLRTVDMMYAGLLILLGILALYVRTQLYNYRRGAPRKLLVLYALNCVVSVYYSVGVTMAAGISIWDTDIQYAVPTAVLMIIINKIYFDKRKHLFVK